MQVYNHNDIKEWYQATYPDDELGKNLNEGLTWENLWDIILKPEDQGLGLYDFLGVQDSVVRERVFSELADVLAVDYDVVYHAWLGGYRKALHALMK